MNARASPAVAQRLVLGEIGNCIHSPTKRKLESRQSQTTTQEDYQINNKRLRFDNDAKENNPGLGGGLGFTKASGLEKIEDSRVPIDNDLVCRGDRIEISGEPIEDPLPDHPQSEATMTDPDLPSSSSGRGDVQLTPKSSIVPVRAQTMSSESDSIRLAATNLKCRLQLAMYKLKSHKEDLSYKHLVPRQLLSGKVEERIVASQYPICTQSQTTTPKAIASNFSNERSNPGFMLRSSSGNDSITETPIRRHYDLDLHTPASCKQGTSSYFSGEKLPAIIEKPDSSAARVHSLPSISSLERALAGPLQGQVLGVSARVSSET